MSKFVENFRKKIVKELQKIEIGAVQRCLNLVDLAKMLKDAYLLVKIGVDTCENEPSKVL